MNKSINNDFLNKKAIINIDNHLHDKYQISYLTISKRLNLKYK